MMTDIHIFKSENYPGPMAIDVKPSKECREYHENSCIQVNIDGKSYVKKIIEHEKDKP